MYTFEEYQREACKSFKPSRILMNEDAEILNWALGIANEAGEVAGIIKHLIFHKEPASKMELAKEIGDILWYIAALCKSCGIPLKDVAELNLAKLRHRHGQSYSAEGSSNRHSREEKFESTEQYQEIKERIEKWQGTERNL